MGKRSKKLKEANDPEASTTSDHLPDIMKNKKKRKHNLELNPENNFVASEDVNKEFEQIIKAEEHELQNSVQVKKKKKKRHLDEQILEEHTEVSNVNDDTKVLKKKKKKSKLLEVEATVQENGQIHDESGELKEQKQKVSKQKKTIDNVVNGDEKQEEKTNNDIVEAKKQKKRSKSKTGNAVLNEEESQVTEEDIDKFCDELDEEDNKQYEEWVKLIEASLPPARAKN